MRSLKFVVVILSLLVGVGFLAIGLGADIPQLEFKDVKAYDVPIGIAFLVFGVAIATFWTITHEQVRVIESESRNPVTGAVEKIKETFRDIKKFNLPKGPEV